MKKNNVPKGVRNEFDDIDYWHKLPKNKYVTLADGTKISYYEYMKKFMHEAYGNSFSRSEPDTNILQTEEQKKWARRNNNNTNRDALLVSKKMGALSVTYQLEKSDYESVVEPWEKTFKYQDYESTLQAILKMSSEELKINFDLETSKKILKTYFRLTKFVKLVRRDKRIKKDKK